MIDLKNYIRDVPDFPKRGILFRDITPLLGNSKAFIEAINSMIKRYKNKGIDVVVAAEARGFIFAGALAYGLRAGFVPVRKKGKLPYRTIGVRYQLEYGTDILYIHEDAIRPGQKVLVVDDLLATGGTAKGMCALVEKLKGKVVEVAFLIELSALKGRKKLRGYNIFSHIVY